MLKIKGEVFLTDAIFIHSDHSHNKLGIHIYHSTDNKLLILTLRLINALTSVIK